MNSKKYLRQVMRYQWKINTLSQRALELRGSMGMGALRYDRDRVQTSPRDTMAEKTGAIVDIEQNIRKLHNIVLLIRGQVEGLEKKKHTDILMLIYFDDCSIREAAAKMKYSYSRARHLHLEALKAFEKKYLVG